MVLPRCARSVPDGPFTGHPGRCRSPLPLRGTTRCARCAFGPAALTPCPVSDRSTELCREVEMKIFSLARRRRQNAAGAWLEHQELAAPAGVPRRPVQLARDRRICGGQAGNLPGALFVSRETNAPNAGFLAVIRSLETLSRAAQPQMRGQFP